MRTLPTHMLGHPHGVRPARSPSNSVVALSSIPVLAYIHFFLLQVQDRFKSKKHKFSMGKFRAIMEAYVDHLVEEGGDPVQVALVNFVDAWIEHQPDMEPSFKTKAGKSLTLEVADYFAKLRKLIFDPPTQA